MIQRPLPLILFALFLFPAALHAQHETAHWTVADVINQEDASELEFAPGGNSLVWVKRRPDREEDKFVTDLYLTRLDITDNGTYKTVQLTRGKESDHSPLFSKDGETIYFLSSRENGKKLWAMSIYGGEPYEVHTFETGISDIGWLGKNRLVFKSTEGKTLHEMQLEKQEDNTIVVEDTAHFKPSRLYSFNLETEKIRRLTDNSFPIGEFAVSDDGTRLVTSHILSPDYAADGNPKQTYYLWNIEEGSKQQILQHGYQTPGNFTFTPDSNGFYFVSVKSSDPEWNGAGITLLHYYDLAKGTSVRVPTDWDWGLGSGFDLVGSDLLVGLANGATTRLAYLKKTDDGWNRKPVDAGPMDGHITVTAVGKDHKKLAYVYSTASTPPQYRTAELKQAPGGVIIPKGKELFELNKHLENKTKARTEVITWTGALGDQITGILYYPHHYEKGRAYPLVVTIHGGPSGVDTDRWNESWTDFNNIMAQKGAFVLQPNYHGSSNHGLEFVESIKGHYYEYELPDIVAGINKLVDEGKVNPDSMGVKGWSNGAILTTMLTVKYPDMFKVAAPGAGDVNWSSDYGTCRFGVQFDQSYFGGAPWDNTDGKIYNAAYIQKSPLFEMEKVRTPTLIHHGSEDRAVPRDQGWEYYRALHEIGKAPVRFLWYPGQPHGLQKITHRTRKMEEEIKWFDQYLFGTYEPKNEAFKVDSPLGERLKKEAVAMEGALYGVRLDGILIPETVAVEQDSIAIGRFEVTNAQYGAFDETYTYPAVRANYPVTGLSVKQARAYTEWLGKMTGNIYRLPGQKEADRLHAEAKKAAAGENTLNYWAGYAITIDEVPELRKKMAQLDRPLLKESGSYRGTEVGNALVYDLGGNAAEYRTDGKTYGYSATSFVDSRGEAPKSAVEYIGFRVIKEQQ